MQKLPESSSPGQPEKPTQPARIVKRVYPGQYNPLSYPATNAVYDAHNPAGLDGVHPPVQNTFPILCPYCQNTVTPVSRTETKLSDGQAARLMAWMMCCPVVCCHLNQQQPETTVRCPVCNNKL